MDVQDRGELEQSMKLWKARLIREQKAARLDGRVTKPERRLVDHARAMIARRKAQLAALHPTPGPRERTVMRARRDVGVVEHGMNNRGPRVDQIEQNFGMIGQPWCGLAVGTWLKGAGVAGLTPRVAYTPFILEDAQASRHGFTRVVWDSSFKHGLHLAHSGSVVLFDFGTSGIKHTGILRKPWNGRGPLYTIEGNTSPQGGAGSQDNGGGCWERTRDVSLVRAIVSPDWRSAA